MNQLLEADIVHVRDFSRSNIMDVVQLKHSALIVQLRLLRPDNQMHPPARLETLDLA